MIGKKPFVKKIKKNGGCGRRQVVPNTNSSVSAAIVVSTSSYTEQLRNMPSLLLAYVYHLNSDNFSKYISFGYSSKNLEPTILLHTVGQGFLELNCLEYTNIILVADKISEYFSETSSVVSTSGCVSGDDNNNNNTIDNRYVDIKYIKRASGGCSGSGTTNINKNTTQKSVMIQCIGNRDVVHQITLNEQEWTCMYELMVFFNALTMWYKASSNDVKVYFQHYVKLCGDTNRLCLGCNAFLYPYTLYSYILIPIYLYPYIHKMLTHCIIQLLIKISLLLTTVRDVCLIHT